MGKRFIMTEGQTQRFIEIYPDTQKEEIMAWLGVSRSTVMKAAKRLGLRKSKEFINAENKKKRLQKRHNKRNEDWCREGRRAQEKSQCDAERNHSEGKDTREVGHAANEAQAERRVEEEARR